ncbi:DUF4238 domain-containing protein [Vibrio splendidus]|uniref:DUF4238 domain-containing protein n=1 Tax=Vibrio splendidus TaxID=29497 RepID=UPI000C84FD83|nr:DUF4238 domain-containing protein [Vibrio splendidus]PMO24172.1 hypothetical protein BCT15_07400 [Vibrio splendidus]
MKKANQLKKEHHYVWANYLRNWSGTKNKVWFRSVRGKLVEDSVKMIAKERHFYHIKPITEDNRKLIKLMSEKSDIREEHMNLLKHFIHVQNMEILYKNSNIKNYEAEEAFEAHKHNSLENLHTAYEQSAAYALKCIANKDLSFFDSTGYSVGFFNYLGQQFARTKAFKDLALLAMSKGDSKESQWIYKNSDESWWFLSHMLGGNLGFSMYSSRDNYKNCLLVNETDMPFITSDCPSVNVHPELKQESFQPPAEEQFDLYYPISPTVAYVYCSSNQFPDGISKVDIETVVKLNTETARGAYIHIFGNSEESLQAYKKHVGERYDRVQTFVNS